MPYIREPQLICPDCGHVIQNRIAMRMHYLRWHTDAWAVATEIAKHAERRYDKATEAKIAKVGMSLKQSKMEVKDANRERNTEPERSLDAILSDYRDKE